MLFEVLLKMNVQVSEDSDIEHRTSNNDVAPLFKLF